ncbi:hypothetical protein KC332_g5337 [Hortaea werneckii]|uniref:RRM domain-containing protein n=2 Tax=Hortaea werneckii TaxID=91943 RepID=A0A3M7IZT5_HORWE|nr:hypothetical protein KC358_g7048 [Hortaea werneckii]OTA35705.1 hypothetical protein BTJ68_04955 [Hortaea werneckii EXF-2000]KAI6845516.1 hypothetical protein KC350_g4397 [Hortaea werneckii]KAI6927645.1 hypothetical protein KC348_g8345 [Hortaea werneckii]KAI6934293.1 hypothetical protein KC341_g7699 [Hortaea werneckii]
MAGLRLYVGSLPYAAQKLEIEQLFADNDLPIKRVDISIDPFMGRNPGYCFVDFHTTEDAEHALETLPGKRVRGRPIKINHNTVRRGNSTCPRLPTKIHGRAGYVHEMPGLNVNSNAYVFDRWSRADEAPARWIAPMEENRRLYVGGLPQIRNQGSLNAEMRVLFQSRPIEAVSKIISPSEAKRQHPGFHYFCFVDISSAADAKSAIAALDGHPNPYGGRYKVKLAMPCKTKPTKVMREQLLLGCSKWASELSNSDAIPQRNLSGNWRRLD